MSLRLKLIFILCLVFLINGGASYVIQHAAVIPSFLALEEEQVARNVDRAIQALELELERLGNHASDWAYWDDLYTFVQHGDPQFIRKNLLFSAFQEVNLNSFYFFDYQGRLIWGKTYDLTTEEELSVDLFPGEAQSEDHPLLRDTLENRTRQGIFLTPQGPLLLVTRPILTSERQGPAMGVLIAGKFLDTALVQQWSIQTRLDLRIYPINEQLPPALSHIVAQLTSNTEQVRVLHTDTTARGYRLLNDLYERPALLLEIDVPRAISARGRQAIHVALLSFAGASLITLLVLWILLRLNVIGPLVELTRQVQTLDLRRKTLLSLDIQRNDEIGILSRALQTATEAASATDRAKSLFLATMSHEIRTPLNSLSAAAELLEDTPLTTDQRRLTHIIRSSADVLLTTINQVLDFSKIEAGQLQLEQTELSLTQIVEGVADLLSLRALEKNLTLLTFVDPTAPDHLQGDPIRLRQVLINLTSNAIKFTASGHIVARVHCLTQGDAHVTLLFEVKDTGIGITPEQARTIFEPFVQADGSTTRLFGGTGLGLAICRAIVQRMGGEIGVDSEVGCGSRFWFRVTLGVLTDRRAAPPDLSEIGVLISIHDPLEAEILRDYLTHRGAFCQLVSVDKAVETLTAHHFHVVVTEYTRSYRTHLIRIAQERGIPLVLLATHFPKAALPGIYQVVRPIRRQVFLTTVATAIGRYQPSPLRQPGRRMSDITVRRHNLRVLLAEDHPANQTVLRLLLEQLGYQVAIAGDGEEAWEMLQNNAYDLLITDAHMPRLGGYDLARRIRQAETETGRRLPIIALTADARAESAEECQAAGIDDWLSKPTSREALREALARVVANRLFQVGNKEPTTAPSLPPSPFSTVVSLGKEPPLPSTPSTVVSPEEEPSLPSTPSTALLSGEGPSLTEELPVLQVEGLLHGTLEGRVDLLVQLLQGFLTESQHHLAKLEAALAKDAWTEVRSAAHAIKGAGHTLGVLRLATLCQNLEQAVKEERLAEARRYYRALPSALAEVAASVEALANEMPESGAPREQPTSAQTLE